jgi:lipopolysaccharide transport system permease protein
VVFTIVFGRIANISTNGLPPVLFYLCGLLSWNYVQQNLANGGTVFITNASMFGKVYFPRLVVPLAMIISNLFAFALQLVSFFGFFVYFKFFTPAATSFGLHHGAFFLPLLIAQTAALSLGVCLWMSSLTAKYRDLTHLLQFLIQLWMFATPVIYPLSNVPAKWKWLADLNPMSAIVEAFRLCLLGTGALDAHTVTLSVCITLAVLGTGVLMFQRTERTFIDTV